MDRKRSKRKYLINAATVSAGEHVLGTRLLLGAVVEGGVLVGSVHAVWIAVANPFLRDALRASPGLILDAGKLGDLVTLPVI